jgi:fatty acid desaturase
MTMTEHELKAKIRADLPPEAFRKRPARMLLVIPLTVSIFLGSVLIHLTALPWYVGLLGSFLLGHLYASLMFLAHEIGHGTTVRSRRLQDLCLYLAGWLFCLSPQLWRVWHNQVHHPFANMEGRDPDSFGTTEEFVRGSRLKRLSVKFAPGSGHPLSICYLLFAFTFHAQVVLWVQSRQMPGFGHLKHRRAIFDSIIMILFWTIVCASIGL